MLSKEQLEAVSHGKGPMMVIAGPGSGKTRVLTERVKRLLDLTAPERICVITFARKAADEMKSRFGDMTDRETAQRVCFGTFHSVFLHWLKEWGLISHGTKVIDREEQDAWTEAWERLHKEGVPAADREAHTEGPREEVPLLCQGDEAAWNIYMADARSRDYLQYKREQKALDFEDILAMMDTAISFFGAYDSYDFFLVDEFQDIDPRQYRILKRMVCREGEEDKANLFVVGDEDQAIYAFRGSDPGLFLHFQEDFPGCRRVILTTNFRCCLPVVFSAGRLISRNRERFAKEIRAADTCFGPGLLTGVRFHCWFDEQEEGRGLALMIRRARMLPPRLGIWNRPKKIAILCRSASEARRIAVYLEEAGVPWRGREEWKGAPDAHAVRVSKDMEVFRRMALSPGNPEVFREFKKLVGSLAGLGDFSKDPQPGEPVWDSLPRKRPAGAKEQGELLQLKRVMEDLGEKERKGELSDRKLLKIMFLETGYLETCLKRLELRGDSREDLLWQILLLLHPSACPVELMTMHGSKGLEFDEVVLPSLVEGAFPRKEAIRMGTLEEERRLMYVAMTRAKLRLHISYFNGLHTKPSRFVNEARTEKD